MKIKFLFGQEFFKSQVSWLSKISEWCCFQKLTPHCTLIGFNFLGGLYFVYRPIKTCSSTSISRCYHTMNSSLFLLMVWHCYHVVWELLNGFSEFLWSKTLLLDIMLQFQGSNSFLCLSNVDCTFIRWHTVVVWPKHVVAITLEEEKKNCCVDGPIIALLIVHTQQEASPQ
jgi:hypothetical protein